MQHFDPTRSLNFRKLISFFGCVLFSVTTMAQVFPVDVIMNNGNRTNRIVFSYLSDGYQSAELGTFITNASTINNGVFNQAPFSQYKNFFNCYAVRVPSVQSGAKHPGTASDESYSGGVPVQPVINPTNYFSSTFDYGSIHRLLVPTNNAGLTTVLAANVPDYDQAFIVVNSPYYGGSGGTYATASTDPSSAEVAIHEIGHSFAGLADEYWAGDFYAAEKPNMTQTTNPTTVKWKSWYGLNNIGIYPYGTSGTPSVWYRPHQLCKMQYLGYPFCSVCSERFVDRIHQLVNMVDSYLPATTTYNLTNTDPVNFSVVSLQTVPATISVKWYLNGSVTPFASNQSAVIIPFATFVNGSNTVKAEVVDNTSLSKSYLPGAGYINSLTWTVFKDPILPVVLRDFSGKLNNRKEAVLSWQIESTNDLKGFDLEKSLDGSNFSVLSQVNSVPGSTAYSFTDPKMYLPDTYYRLYMKDKNGTGTYSPILKLSNPFDKFSYKIYQDPQAHKYHFTCVLSNKENVSLKIMSAEGKEVFRKSFTGITNKLDFDFDLNNQPAGVYFANIQIGTSAYTVQISAN